MPHTSKTSYEYKVHVSGAKITCRPTLTAQKTHKFGVLLLLTCPNFMCSKLM